MTNLFQPLQLKNHTLSNRIIVSPMCQYSAANGFATDWHLVHLGQYAIGKAAAIIQEATAVTPEGRISYGDLGIWDDTHIEKLKQITTFIKSQGSLPGLQLAHAGRKASTEIPWLGRRQICPEDENGWQTVGPSNLPFQENEVPPRALQIDEIAKLVTAFQHAARRAVLAGYEIIEIHAAHGYLIHQFFSPLINNRKDIYGGSFENRIRFLIEIIKAIQKELSTQSLWVRISATDWAEGGWNLEESIALARILKELKVEVVDISTGGAVSHQMIDTGLNYQVPFASAIKKHTNLVTGTVGLITSALQAEEILKNKEADLIFIGREFLRNPQFVRKAADDLKEPLPWPKQYERAKESK